MMPETISKPQVQCEVSEGLMGADITVTIVDAFGREQ